MNLHFSCIADFSRNWASLKQVLFNMAKLSPFYCVFLFFYFAESKTYTGTIYAHNWFKLWVNGKEIATDPLVSHDGPQNAVTFSFEDGK